MAGPSARDRRLATLVRYGLSAAAVLVALCLELLVRATTGSHYLFIALAPAVAFGAWFGGTGPGILAIALSMVGMLHITPSAAPYVQIDPWVDGVALGIFVGCWTLVSVLAG